MAEIISTTAIENTNSDCEVIPFGAIMHGDYKLLAIEKLREETEKFNGTTPIANCIKDAVSKMLVRFCDENELVAEVVYKTKRSLGDCCDFIAKKVDEKRKNGSGSVAEMSDAELYSHAVQFYFPDSTVKAQITIEVGEKPSAEVMEKLYERPVPPQKQPKPDKKAKKKAEKPKSDQQFIEGAFDEVDAADNTLQTEIENTIAEYKAKAPKQEKSPENKAPEIIQLTLF